MGIHETGWNGTLKLLWGCSENIKWFEKGNLASHFYLPVFDKQYHSADWLLKIRFSCGKGSDLLSKICRKYSIFEILLKNNE